VQGWLYCLFLRPRLPRAGLFKRVQHPLYKGYVRVVCSQCTLLAATRDYQSDVAAATKKALQWLVHEAFITWVVCMACQCTCCCPLRNAAADGRW
jgi:hypothetical protein